MGRNSMSHEANLIFEIHNWLHVENWSECLCCFEFFVYYVVDWLLDLVIKGARDPLTPNAPMSGVNDSSVSVPFFFPNEIPSPKYEKQWWYFCFWNALPNASLRIAQIAKRWLEKSQLTMLNRRWLRWSSPAASVVEGKSPRRRRLVVRTVVLRMAIVSSSLSLRFLDVAFLRMWARWWMVEMEASIRLLRSHRNRDLTRVESACSSVIVWVEVQIRIPPLPLHQIPPQDRKSVV